VNPVARKLPGWRAVALLVAIVIVGFAIATLWSRSELIAVTRVDARSGEATVIVEAAYNDCSHDPRAALVREDDEAVTIRVTRRRDLLGDGCWDSASFIPFEVTLAEPLGDRVVRIETPSTSFDCVVDGASSDRCVRS
jgi:hypothetical protein